MSYQATAQINLSTAGRETDVVAIIEDWTLTPNVVIYAADVNDPNSDTAHIVTANFEADSLEDAQAIVASWTLNPDAQIKLVRVDYPDKLSTDENGAVVNWTATAPDPPVLESPPEPITEEAT